MVKIFTNEMVEFIKENVVGTPPAELLEKLNNKFNTQFSKTQLKNFYARNKLSSGLSPNIGYFKKGSVPHNKGKKMPDWVKEKIKQTKTQFEKGHVPQQTLPLGTETKDKNGYIEVKVTANKYESAGNRGKCSKFDTKWIGKHKKVWIDENGDNIPPRHKIIFLDKNKYNFDITNLACVSNGKHAILCKKHRYSENPEITATNITLTELEQKLKALK